MFDILIDALLDSLKLLPFLFVTFLILEYIEHKSSLKTRSKIVKVEKYGPLFGSLIGAIPQCGFSVSATNLYATRVITIGTLISVYLSTSDEMLPVMLSTGASVKLIISILSIKIFVGMISGFIIDLFVFRKNNKIDITNFCDEEHCHCENGVFLSALIHTVSVLIYILIINIIISFAFSYFEDSITTLFKESNILSVIFATIIGIIPNCASSVLITELYLSKILSFGALISGLLMNSGVGIGVLFKVNKNKKENFMILLTLFVISLICGIIINIIM